MRHEVRFSGFGGQGIILSAVILGRAAVMYDSKFAIQTQVYGPEARGGRLDEHVVNRRQADPLPQGRDSRHLLSSCRRKGSRSTGKGGIPRCDDPGLYARPLAAFVRFIEIAATQQAKENLEEGYRGQHRDARGGRGQYARG